MAPARVADILASVARGGPASGWPAELVQTCRTATRVSGVGLAVTDATGTGGVRTAPTATPRRWRTCSSPSAGPCVDAARSGRPVRVADLSRDAAGRWPAFTEEATGQGVPAACTVTLWVGAIGVLDLYRTARAR
jgi:hypothetical protein